MSKKITLFVLSFFLLLNYTQSQVTADFTYSDDQGCGSLQVSFCDNSTSATGSIISWTWDLAGASSDLECPGRVFSTPGSYDICLTATDDQGFSDQICRSNLIVVHPNPVADFSANLTIGCAPQDIVFSDQSTPTSAPIVAWDWDLSPCGVQNNTTADPVFCNYPDAGIYSAALTVIDANGCTDTEVKNDLVEIFDKPSIQLSADNTFGCEPPFDINFSNDNIQPNTNYTWDFGNGITFSGNTPGPITYNDFGNFTVILTAENLISGCIDSLVIDDYITIGYPIEYSIESMMVCQGEVIQFRDLSPNHPPDSRVWDFGDGTTKPARNPVHAYSAPGCYTVSLTRTIAGCSRTITEPVCIQVFPLPTVSINNDNSIGCALPHVVNFIGVAPFAQSWSWDFGDGNTSTDPNPTHLYNDYGDYMVSLTVTDANGCSNTFDNTMISVQEVQASLATPYFEGCTPLNFIASENSSSITPITNWNWQITTDMALYTSTDEMPSFSIPDTGVWDLTLVVTNSLGCSDIETFEGAVSVGMLPVVDFEANPLEECIESDVRFMDLSSDYGEEWLWNFGDGEESTQQNIIHQYQDTGFYDISLTVGHNGCYNTLTVPDYVHILEPLAKFDVDFDCDRPFERIFIDRSIGAEVVHWDFGVTGVNDDTSNVFNPVFNFPGPGTYEISMTVFNATTSCTHTETELIEITLPAAQFSVDQTQGCAPLTISVSESSNFPDVWSWDAPGGDISNPNAPEPNITYDTPGAYTNIQLIIEDVNACQDTFIFTDTIFVNAVTPDFIVNPAEGCRPLSVDFQDNSSSLFGTNTQWTWNFADGLGSATGTNANFVFDTIGIFPVSLRVRDDWGCFATLEIPDAVEVTQPVADFTTADTLSCTDHCVLFSNHSDGENLTYLWDFGDGNTSTDVEPTHCFSQEGLFTICLTVTDKFGCDSTLCKNDYVVISDPVANFNAGNTQGTCPPFEVSFLNNSTNATTFQWDFGDGSDSSILIAPTHTYQFPGNFDVQLIAESTPFCKDTLLLPDFIELLGPSGNFTFIVDTTCAPTKVTFTGTSTDDYQYLWDFGDGETESILTFQNTNTTTHVYQQEGDYFPTLTLIDNTGCSRTFDTLSPVHISDISIDFFTPDTLQCGFSQEVDFLNLSFSQDLISGFMWEIENGNPNVTSDIEPSVSFPGNGSYDVTLIAENEFCRDTLYRPDYIRIGPIPEAIYSMDVNDGCNPLTVNFTDQSTLTTGILDTWVWNFGDGDSSSLTNPTHVYDTSGVLEATLTVFSEIGCSDDTTQSISIWQPLEVITTDDQEICIGETISLSVAITGDTTGATYFWEGGADLSCTSCLEPNVTPLDTTTYTFVIIDLQGCRSEGQTTINVLPVPVPVIDLTSDTTICFGNLVQLIGEGGSSISSYEWDATRPGLNCYNDCNNPVASPEETTTYVLTVSNEIGCSSQDSVTITVIGTPTPFASDDQVICAGEVIQLGINSGTNPIWTAEDGLSCVFCPDPFVSPDTSTVFEVSVESPEGCVLVDSVFVEVIPTAAVDAGEEQSNCIGVPVTLTGVGEGQVSWSPSNLVDDPNQLNTIANPTSTTTFFLTVENGLCTLVDSVVINVESKTVIGDNAFEICAGESVEIFPLGNADVFEWSPLASLSDLTIANPIANPQETTTYEVVGTQSSCQSDTAFVTVSVIPGPEIEFYDQYDFFQGQAIDINLNIDSLDQYEILWSPSSIVTCDDCSRITALVDETTLLDLEVFDRSTGCMSNLSTTLNLLESCSDELIKVPTAFSPNDDGANDELRLFPSPSIEQIYSFTIFNRWGAIVFSTNNIQDGWDGRYKGVYAPAGVYVYLVEANCPVNGRRIMKTGDVLLVR